MYEARQIIPSLSHLMIVITKTTATVTIASNSSPLNPASYISVKWVAAIVLYLLNCIFCVPTSAIIVKVKEYVIGYEELVGRPRASLLVS